MTCSVIRNSNMEIERVLAPNREDSILFNNINQIILNKELALRAWAQVYTKNFKEWFGDWEKEGASKAVDKNGEPLLLYHGTFTNFNTFEYSDSAGTLGNGYYFTDDLLFADDWAKAKFKALTESDVAEAKQADITLGENILPVFLNIKEYGPDKDGDTAYDETTGNEFVVRDSNQIKSLFNDGGFSPDFNNIYYQNSSLANPEFFNASIRTALAGLPQAEQEAYKGTRAEGVKARYGKLLDRLQKKFGIQWVEDNEQDTLGRFENGRVYLNLNKMQADTPFHEFAHPFVELIRQKNPLLFKSLANRSKNVFNTQGISISDSVTARYPELTGDDLNAEIITTAIGLSAVGELTETNNNPRILSNFMEILEAFVDKIISYLQTLRSNPDQKIRATDIDTSTNFKDLSNILFETDNEVDLEGLTIDQVLKQKSDDIFSKFKEIKNKMTLRVEDHKYFYDGKEVKDSVHSKVVEPYLRQIYGEREWDAKSQQFNEMLRDRGTEIHNDMEEIGKRYVDPSTGLLRDTPLPKGKPNTNDAIYNTAEEYLKEVFKTYEKGTRFLFEQPVYDSITNTAGTIDFLAITKDGGIEIKDWKSIKTSIGSDQYIADVNHIKQTQWKIQIGEYKRIIESNLGAKVISGMAIPIESNPDSIFDTDIMAWTRTKSSVIQIGDIDPTKIPKELAYLAPVVLKDHSTGDKQLDDLVKALYQIYETTRKELKPAEGESRQAWLRKLNSTAETIRDLQVRKDINTLLQNGNDLLYQTKSVLAREVGDDLEKIKQKLGEIQELKEEAFFVSNLQKYFYKQIQENKLNDDQKDFLMRLTPNAIYVEQNLTEVEQQLSEKLANNKGVSNITKAELKLKGSFPILFKHLSQFTNRTILTFRKYYDDYRNKRDRQTVKDLTSIEEKVKDVESWAGKNGMTLSKAYELLFAKDKNGKVNPNRMLYKYNSDFWSLRETARSKGDEAWFKANYSFNREKYEAAKKKQLEWETQRATQSIQDLERRANSIDRAMKRYESLYDIQKNPKAWMYDKNYFLEIKGNLSKEWNFLHAKGNEALLNFYNEIVRFNKRAMELDMIGSESFLAAVRADKMEQIFSNSGEGATKMFQFLDDIKAREGEGFLERDAITGQEIKRIPILFNRSLARKNEDGTLDNSMYSRDLGRNLAIWAAHINDYKMKSDLEIIGNAMVNVEKEKNVIAKDRYGNAAKENGAVVEERNTGANSEILGKFVDYMVYGKAGYSDSDIEIKGYSGMKAGRKLMAWMSHRTLGLNATSAVTNLFGGSLNAFVQLTRTGLATKTEWFQSMAEITGGNDKAKGLLTLIDPLMENKAQHRINALSMTTVNKYINTDKLYIMMQGSDRAVQLPVALSVMKNYMIHEGKLRKVRDVAKEQSSYNIEGLNMSQIKELDKKLASKIDELKKKSIFSTTEIKDGKVTNEEWTDDLVTEMREIIRRVNKSILGNMSTEDINLVRLTAIGSFGMQFRNWMPQLVSERFKGADMDYDLGVLSEGKVRTTFNHFASRRILALTKEAIFGLSDVSLGRMQERYQKLKQTFIDKGGEEDKFVSFSDFKDSYFGNIRSTMQEIGMLLSLVTLVTAVGSQPPEDNENKGPHKLMLKVLGRIGDELSFFYNPASLTDLIQKPIPALGIITDIENLITKSFLEGYYSAKGDETAVKKNKPKRYFWRLFPIAKEAELWLATFNDDYRKENDIRLIH